LFIYNPIFRFFKSLTALLALVGCTTSAVLAMLFPNWMNIIVRRRYGLRISFGRWLLFLVLNLLGGFTVRADFHEELV
jgi:hypothetical protein